MTRRWEGRCYLCGTPCLGDYCRNCHSVANSELSIAELLDKRRKYFARLARKLKP
jgi:hypothetical protein